MNSRKNNFLKYILFEKNLTAKQEHCLLYDIHSIRQCFLVTMQTIYVITAEKSYINTNIDKNKLIIILHILKYAVIIFLCYNIPVK